MSYRNIIFDLDGTIVDSAKGIELSFKYAYLKTYGKELNQSIRLLIGPPIDKVLFELNRESDQNNIDTFISFFKVHYDDIGVKSSFNFVGMLETLEFLKNTGRKLFIATNKRYLPTQLILKLLEIEDYFLDIYCSDFPNIFFPNKSEMLSNLILKHSLINKETLMIGDTIHDSDAANYNNINFVFVEYGYGNCHNPKYRIKNIKQLVNIIE
jgi:phosphoglycolate phosphatase